MTTKPQTNRPSRARTKPTATPAPVVPTPKGKLGIVVGLLRAPGGAALGTLMTATGWQAHSVRGAIAGSLKKKLGLTIISEKTDAGRTYRIQDVAA